MTSLLAPIRARLQLTLRRRSTQLLQGEQVSTHRGRSMEFEDLREYVPGDDVKDIDWKATARGTHPLVRQYAALRTRQVTFVVDAGRGMGAHAAGLEPKRDIVRELVGMVGLVAVASGDRVSLVHGDAAHSAQLPPGGSHRHLEQLLRTLETALAAPDAASDLAVQLEFVAARQRRRAVLVVIGDDRELDAELQARLRRLVVQHDVVWLTIADLDPTVRGAAGAPVVDVDSGVELPAFLRASRRMARELGRSTQAHAQERRRVLANLGVHELRIAAVDEVLPRLFELFERLRRSGGRRGA